MANGFDPRITLGLQGTNVSDTFRNILTNIGEQQRQAEQAELQPLRQQLLQAQGIQAQSQALSERDTSRLTSVANFAQEVLPSLRRDDPQEALSLAQSRLARMRQTIADNPGIQLDTTETEEFINMLATPEGQLVATERAEQAVQLAQSQGLLGQTGAPAGLREFTGLVEAAGLTPEETQKAAKVRLGLEARAGNFAQRLQFEINKQRDAGNIKVEQQLRKTAGDLGIKLDLDPKIAAKVEEAKLPALERRETIKANTKRISFLSDDQRKRDSSVRKARQFLKPLQEGRAFSGATRAAASFIPGVFTSQAQFDEKFNAFAEVAARQQLKASGEIRPTDADVEGMKRAMFGVGRDEQVNVELLQEFIQDQEALNDELEDLTEARTTGRLDTFDIQQQRAPAQQPLQQQAPITQPVQQPLQQPAQQAGQLNSSVLGRVVTEQDIQDTLNANPGMTREQLLRDLGIQ